MKRQTKIDADLKAAAEDAAKAAAGSRREGDRRGRREQVGPEEEGQEGSRGRQEEVTADGRRPPDATPEPPPTTAGRFTRWPWWRRWFGRRSERAAARFLRSLGYRVLAANVSDAAGELDLLALDGETLVVVEVRSTASDRPDALDNTAASVDLRKQRKITEATLRFLAAPAAARQDRGPVRRARARLAGRRPRTRRPAHPSCLRGDRQVPDVLVECRRCTDHADRDNQSSLICVSAYLRRYSESVMPVPPVDEQLAVILRGAAQVETRDELRKKLERSFATGKPLRVKYGIDPTGLRRPPRPHGRRCGSCGSSRNSATRRCSSSAPRRPRSATRAAATTRRQGLTPEQIEKNAETYLDADREGHRRDRRPRCGRTASGSRKFGFAEMLRLLGQITDAADARARRLHQAASRPARRSTCTSACTR